MTTRAKNAWIPKEAESVQHVEQTAEDRKEYKRQWQEDRDHKEKIKKERFEAINERRKQGKPD